MKNIFILSFMLFIISSCNKKRNRDNNVLNIYKNQIDSKTFLSNVILGNNIPITKIKLWKDSTLGKRKMVGIISNFQKNKFTSGNFAPCGNDYFTDVYGEYEFYDNDKLVLSIDSIVYSGEFKKPSEYMYKQKIDYSISKKGDTIILTKID